MSIAMSTTNRLGELLVREKLTGAAPPDNVREMIDQWRDWLLERAGNDFDDLADHVQDQAAFARTVRRVISDLELGEEENAEEMDADAEGEGEEQEATENEDGSSDSDKQESADLSSSEDQSADQSEGEEGAAEDAMDDMDAGSGEGDGVALWPMVSATGADVVDDRVRTADMRFATEFAAPHDQLVFRHHVHPHALAALWGDRRSAGVSGPAIGTDTAVSC